MKDVLQIFFFTIGITVVLGEGKFLFDVGVSLLRAIEC